MPILPSVQKDAINVSGGESNMAAVPESGIGQFAGFVNDVAKDYFIDEKHQFDKVRIIEAQNVMEAHKSRLQIDEKEGYQNKLGEQAFLFKDDEGRDFVNSYADRYNRAAEDTITQLQLTPDQQKMFREMTAKDSQRWVEGIRQHQVKEGFRYKESVLTNTVELASRKAMGSYQDIDSMEENLTTINAAVTEMGKQFGWSQAEVTNNIAKQYAAVHNANLKSIIDGGDFELGEAYLANYSSHIPEINRHGYASAINDLKENFITQQRINMLAQGMEYGSNPAYNTSDPELLNFISIVDDDESGLELTEEEKAAGLKPKKISPKSALKIKYDDPRLDAITEKIGRDEGMDWAKPIVTALRVAGERSNNDQVSPAGAKGIMQFMPIAVEQVRRITGKTINPLNPEEAIWGAYKFVEWISKKEKTRDPAIIASYYNGGGQFTGQLRSGGVNAITDEENRNYVKRISGFIGGSGYQEHVNRPMMGERLDPRLLQGLKPEQQAKVISAHESMLRNRETARKARAEDLYNAAMVLVEDEKITSIDDLDRETRLALNPTQRKGIEAALKASRLGEYDDATYLDYVTNPSVIKTMSNGQFKEFLLTSVPPDKREGVARDYAQLTGRTVADARAIEKQNQTKNKRPEKSIVSETNVAAVLTRNAGAIGFSTGKTGTSKVAGTNQKGSSFWVATIRDITDRVRDVERRKGVNLTSADIDNVVNAYLDNSRLMKGGESKGLVYDPRTFKRKEVPEYINDYVMKKEGGRYAKVSDIPDTVFMKHYFRWYRGIR